MEEEGLKQIWNILSTKNIAHEEHGKFLDIFLAEYLLFEVKHGKKPHCFQRNQYNVANLLSHCFLSDVHEICCDVSSRSLEMEVPAEEDLSSMTSYLLNGRGWKILWVLRSLELKSLSYVRELGSLLLSLLPVALKINDRSSSLPDVLHGNCSLPEISDLFKMKTDTNQLESSRLQKFSDLSLEKFRSLNLKKKSATERATNKLHHFEMRVSSDSDQADTSSYRLSNRIRKKIAFIQPTHDFEYFSKSAIPSEAEDLEEQASQILINKSAGIAKMSQFFVSGSELTECILHLLQWICIADLQERTPYEILPDAYSAMLQTFLFVNSDSWNAGSWDPVVCQRTRFQVLQILFCCAKGKILENDSKHFSHLGLLIGELLRVCDDAAKSTDHDRTANAKAKFAYDILLGCLFLINTATSNVLDSSELPQLVQIIRTFSGNSGTHLCCQILLSLESKSETLSCKHLIFLIKNILISLKRLKVFYTHKLLCFHKKHRKCDIIPNLHHHHDSLGLPTSHSIINRNPFCCVSTFGNILLKMFSTVTQQSTQMVITTALQSSGICCCTGLCPLLENITCILPRLSYEVQVYSLSVFENTLLRQSGLAFLPGSKMCHLCSHYLSREELPVAGGIFRDKTKPWKHLVIYRSHVLSDNYQLSTIVCRHLLHFVQFAHIYLKKDIFNRVILPVFFSVLKNNASGMGQHALDILEFCLQSFAKVLCHTSLLHIFLQKNCLTHLRCLLNIPKLKRPILKVLKVVIQTLHETDGIQNSEPILILEEILKENNAKYFRNLILGLLNNFELNGIEAKGEETNLDVFISTADENIFKLEDDLIQHQDEEDLNEEGDEYILGNEFEEGGILMSESSNKDPRLDSTDRINFLDVDSEMDSPKESYETETFTLDESKSHMPTVDSGIETLSHATLDCSQQLEFIIDTWKVYQEVLSWKTATLSQDCLIVGYELFLVTLDILSWYHEKPAVIPHLKCLATLMEIELFICMSMVPFHLSEERVIVERDILEILKRKLTLCCNADKSLMRHIYDALLHCATGITSFCQQAVRKKATTRPADDLGHMPGTYSTSSSASDTCLDHGYEADNEMSKDIEHSQDAVNQSAIVHGPVCCVILEVVKQEIVVKSGQVDRMDLDAAQHILQRFIHFCQSSDSSYNLLHSQGIQLIKELLETVMEIEALNCRELLRHLIQLYVLLTGQSMSTSELSFYLELMKFPTAPLGILLDGLGEMVRTCQVQPLYSLPFPCHVSVEPTECQSSVNWSDSWSFKIPFINPTYLETSNSTNLSIDLPRCMQNLFTKSGMENSVWVLASGILPLSQDISWNPRQKGFSISFWLKINPNPTATRNGGKRFEESERSYKHLLHILSLGSDFWLLEIWTDPLQLSLLFKITSSSSSEYMKLADLNLESILEENAWNHISVNCKEKAGKKPITIEIDVLVDGARGKKDILYYNLSTHKKSQSSFLLFGHSSNKNISSSYELGNIMLFKECVLDRNTSFLLWNLGPDIENLTDGILDNQIFCPIHIPSDVLVLGVNVPYILLNWMQLMKALQEHLLAIYNLRMSKEFLLYPQIVKISNTILPPVGNINSTNFRVVTDDTRVSQQHPVVKSVVWNYPVDAQLHPGFHLALHHLGGLPVFVFLFAMAVESSDSRHVQSTALKVLLRLVTKHYCCTKSFYQADGVNLVKYVLENEKCICGNELLQVIANAAVGQPLVKIDFNSGDAVIDTQTEFVLKHPKLLTMALSAWRAWEKVDPLIPQTLLNICKCLIRDQHPHEDFNMSQLRSVNLIETLLTMLKERFIHFENLSLSSDFPVLACELIRKITGHPPEASVIQMLWNALILLHPLSYTYVSYGLASMYFHLPSYGIRGNTSSKDEKKVDVPSEEIQAEEKYWEGSSSTSLERLSIYDTTKDDQESAGSATDTSLSVFSQSVAEDEMSSTRKGFSDPESQNAETFGISRAAAADKKFAMLQNEDLAGNDSSESKDEDGWINFSEKASAQVLEKHFKAESPDALVLVSSGLLSVLQEIVITLPDSMISTIISPIMSAETFLVMSLHHSGQVRSEVVKLLTVYLHRANSEQKNNFLKIKGFHLLANQLSQYPTVPELVTACLGLLLDEVIPNAELDINTFPEILPTQLMAVVPLMSLLPGSVNDTALCHNLIHIIKELCEHVNKAFSVMMENGFVVVIARFIVELGHSKKRATDMDGSCEQDLLIEDLHDLLRSMVDMFCIQNGHQWSSEHVQNFIFVMSAVELQATKYCGCNGQCSTLLRDCEIVVLNESIQMLQASCKQEFEKDNVENSSVLITEVLLTMPLGFSSKNINASFSQGKTLNVSAGRNSKSHRSKKKTKDAFKTSCGDILEGFLQLLTTVVKLIAFRDAASPYSDIESSFCADLLQIMLNESVFLLGPCKIPKKSHLAMFNAAKDKLCPLLSKLLLAQLSPDLEIVQRIPTFHLLVSCHLRGNTMSSFLDALSNEHLTQLIAFLYDLLRCDSDELTGDDLLSLSQVLDTILEHHVSRNNSPTVIHFDPEVISLEQSAWMERIKVQRSMWSIGQKASAKRILKQLGPLVSEMVKSGKQITENVGDAHNAEMKIFMDYIKSSYNQKLNAQKSWLNIIQNLTHERAVWNFKKSTLCCWGLDPTEGPMRIRRRLQKCSLNIMPRFLRPQFQKNLESERRVPPLDYLFVNTDRLSGSSVVIEKLHTNERIVYHCICSIVTPSRETQGEVLIGNHCIHFVADDRKQSSHSNDDNMVSQAWPFDNIKEIVLRRYQLQDSALEVFLTDGHTYLLAFNTTADRDKFFGHLLDQPLPNVVATENLSFLTEMWRDRAISNFEYLTHLNKMSGRSFNDLMQYPVFPFILSNYTDDKVDLNSPSVYRNLSKPMAIQNKKKEQHYVSLYNYLKTELQGGASNTLMLPAVGPYHYGSHYSNSGTVLHFLVRLPPFTQMFLAYQDNNFDIPDRTFHNLATSWKLASGDSATDVKELIPEFFYLPEFLLNSEGFNLGVRQSGEEVNNIILPLWCGNDPRLFVLVHRQALESDYVTENLHNWIDLVFGYKQTGKAAVDSINVFHPATYYGVNVNLQDDLIRRNALQTMIRTFGQMPKQLFHSPHPAISLQLALDNATSNTIEVLPDVKGLRWGSYIGSPAEPEPAVVWKSHHPVPLGSLVPLLTNDVFGLACNNSLLLTYSKEKAGILNITYVTSSALLTWGLSDGVLRIKLKRESPPLPLLQGDPLDPVTVCLSVPDCPLLFVGCTSGTLIVYNLSIESGLVSAKFPPSKLLGHKDAVTVIVINKAFGIVVTSSKDNTVIIWDLNKLSYVRTIEFEEPSVKLLCVSETLGDIACVTRSDTSSSLIVHSINGKHVGTTTSLVQITAITYSSSPEGTSVNVIATGLADGTIKLWSSWNLEPVRIIRLNGFGKAIACLTYSIDNQYLYVANIEGSIVVWEKSTRGLTRTPRFLTVV